MLVIGVEFTGFSKLHQLLKVAGAADRRRTTVFAGSGDRAADGVELGQVALQIQRVGDDALESQPEHARKLALPFAYIGFGGGDGYPVPGDRHGQDIKSCRVGLLDDPGDCAHVDLQRVDAQVRQVRFVAEPSGQSLQSQGRAGWFGALPALSRHPNQWMLRWISLAAAGGIQLLRLCFADQAVANQLREHERKGELPFTARYLWTGICHRFSAVLPRMDYT